MSTALTIVVVTAVAVLVAVLVSYAKRLRSTRDRERALLASKAEEHRGAANSRRRRASDLASHASELADNADALMAKAERLDNEAAKEMEAARSDEKQSAVATRRTTKRQLFPINLTRRRDSATSAPKKEKP